MSYKLDTFFYKKKAIKISTKKQKGIELYKKRKFLVLKALQCSKFFVYFFHLCAPFCHSNFTEFFLSTSQNYRFNSFIDPLISNCLEKTYFFY